MPDTTRSPIPAAIAAALLITVVTQIAYMTVKGDTITGPMIWGVEAFAFLAINLLALAALRRSDGSAVGWAGLAAFGLLNLGQVGIGLTMFGPLGDGGDATATVMGAVLGFAFFLYFAAKFALAVTAVLFGLTGIGASSIAVKSVSVLAIGAGIFALVANGAAMALGREAWITYAGASGTVAALALAIMLFLRPASTQQVTA